VGFASPGGAVWDESNVYAAPAQLGLNSWALAGSWAIGREAVLLNKVPGRIVYRFHARDLNLVMGPTTRGGSVRFRVLVDGQPAGAARGSDVDADGYGTASEQRTYQLIRQSRPIINRLFEIEVLSPGMEAFDFTFG